jgi:hypothetical protein
LVLAPTCSDCHKPPLLPVYVSLVIPSDFQTNLQRWDVHVSHVGLANTMRKKKIGSPTFMVRWYYNTETQRN